MKLAERRALASAIQVTVEQAAELATDPVIAVRRRLAQRTDLTEDVFQRLARDPSKAVCIEVATNPCCPASALVVLLADERVAYLAASDGAHHPDVAAAAVQHPQTLVKECFAAALDPSSPHMISMAHDPESKVRERVAERTANPDAIDVLIADAVPAVVRELAGNQHLTSAQMERLSHSPLRRVRMMVATRHDLTDEAVARLTRDRSADVRWNVLMHQNSRAVCQALAADRDEIIRNHARSQLAQLATREESSQGR